MSALPGRTEADVQSALAAVMDPELPFLSIVDLGIVGTVEVGPGRVRVELLPTFVGCPALDLIRDTVVERLTELAPDAEIGVEVSFAPPWTSDRISEEGRRQLRLHGFAPPERLHDGGTTAASPWLGSATASATTAILLLRRVPCPHCGSRRTELENVFGSTLCRAIHHCSDCRQPFEQFKPV